jgi:hypothetical protein
VALWPFVLSEQFSFLNVTLSVSRRKKKGFTVIVILPSRSKFRDKIHTPQNLVPVTHQLPTVSRSQRKKRLRNERKSQITKKKLTSIHIAQSMAIASIKFLLAKKKAIESQDWGKEKSTKTRHTFVLVNYKKSQKSCKKTVTSKLTANNVDRRSLKQKKGAQRGKLEKTWKKITKTSSFKNLFFTKINTRTPRCHSLRSKRRRNTLYEGGTLHFTELFWI